MEYTLTLSRATAAPHRHIVKMGFHLYLRSRINAAKKLPVPIQSMLPSPKIPLGNTTIPKIESPAPRIKATTAGRRQASTLCKTERSRQRR